MAAILVPGVEHRLLSGKSTTPLDARVITVHTMAGYMAGTESYFTPAGRPYSHFGVGGDGRIRQWQDLRFRAASDYQGNPFTISIECEDHGVMFPLWSGSNVPMFTAKQADALEVLLSWLCHRFGLPKKAIGTSCPSERGIGWHRLGIDPWRYPTCLKWSSSRGKACPGDNRIAQLRNDIIPRISSPEVDMPLNDADKNWLRELSYDRRDEINAHTAEAAVTTALRVGMYLGANKGNAVFNPTLPGREWMADAVTMPQLAALVKGIEPAVLDVDEAAIAAELAPLLTSQMRVLSDADLAAIAVAVNDEQHRRSAD